MIWYQNCGCFHIIELFSDRLISPFGATIFAFLFVTVTVSPSGPYINDVDNKNISSSSCTDFT